jgi:hypothetical protein
MTDNHQYNTPKKGATDWHIPLNENFERLDNDVEVRDLEGNLDSYAPGEYAKFLAVDTGAVYIGDGSTWNKVGVIGDGSGAIDAPSSSPGVSHASIPTESGWTERGTVFTASELSYGSNLDDCLSPSQIVELDGTYYLYYVVADGTRSSDGGPKRRALCVASTTDINDPSSWTNHQTNPILTFQPNDGDEEGILTAVATVRNGTIHLFYSTMEEWPDDRTIVMINVEYATSADGVSFTHQGRALDIDDDIYGDPSSSSGWNEVWGLGVQVVGGTWYLYYRPKGSDSTARQNLGVAWSSDPLSLGDNSTVFLDLPDKIHSLCNPVARGSDDGDSAMLILQGGVNATGSEITQHIYTTPDTDPTSNMARQDYNFNDIRHSTLFRDDTRWYMFYQTADKQEFRLRTASL